MKIKKSLLFGVSTLALLGAGSMLNHIHANADTIFAKTVYVNGTPYKNASVKFTPERTQAKKGNIWYAGIPKKLSSENGWISNVQKNKKRYVRYTTPLFTNGYYSEGVNLRPHYYKSRSQKAGKQLYYGKVTGNQANPYYHYLGNNSYQIISGNYGKDGLTKDLAMYHNPKKYNFNTPTFATVKSLNDGAIQIWNNHKFTGTFHRMSNKVVNQLGY